jgi:hypothetical protein
MRPDSAVHPLVAPLFSTAEYTLDELGSDHEILSPTMQSPTRSITDEPGDSSRNNFEHQFLLNSDIPVASATRRWSEEPPSPFSRLRGRAAEESPAQQITPFEDRAGFREPDPGNAVYQPLIHTITTSVPRPPTDPRHESPYRSLPQHPQQRAAEPARAAVPKHEPDEIQITIGRIEVTAVSDAPRPAPKPARKQLSLDDYLKQADARGR